MTFRALTNYQIDNYFKNTKNYGGMLCRDELPQKFSKKFIVLNQDLSSGDGTHYNLIFPTSKSVLFFDPFGVAPCPEAVKYMKKSKKEIVFNTIDLQNIH